MATLKIHVGASVDRNLAVAFQPLVDAAEKARKKIDEKGRAAGEALGRATKKGGNEAERALAAQARAAEKAARDQTRAAEASAKAQARAAERATRDRQRENDRLVRDGERAERALVVAAERGAAARARAEERALRVASRQARRDDAQLARVGLGAARSALRTGIGIAGGVARGAGVELNLEQHVRSGVELEKQAVDLSNAGLMPLKAGQAPGPNNVRQDPRAIVEQVRRIAMATGNQSGDAMAGLQAFVGKTGDLETGRAVLFDLAKLSKATGANLEDMTDAAGDVANALGDMPNKGAAVQAVMAAIAAQGKEGAVEIKDLATQMAKLGAASSQYHGDPQQVMAQMGALVQMTRAKGGAASATQAATAVGTFTATFSKGARRKAFDAAGVRVEDSDGKIRNTRDIIIDALRATKGNTVEMGKMFMDVNARRVTRGWETIYKEAGGGEKGIEAVRKAFDDLAGTVINNKEVEASFAAAMKTGDAQAKVFNEELAKTANELRTGLTPALQALAPAIISASNRAVEWFVKPKTESLQASKDISTEGAALNARSALRQGLETGELQAGDTEKAAQARDALKAALERKQKELAEQRENQGMNAKFMPTTHEEVERRAKEGSGYAAKMLQTEQQVGRMQDTLNTLNSDLEQAMTRSLASTFGGVRPIKVIVTNGDDIFKTRPNLDDFGREPPPGQR